MKHYSDGWPAKGVDTDSRNGERTQLLIEGILNGKSFHKLKDELNADLPGVKRLRDLIYAPPGVRGEKGGKVPFGAVTPIPDCQYIQTVEVGLSELLQYAVVAARIPYVDRSPKLKPETFNGTKGLNLHWKNFLAVREHVTPRWRAHCAREKHASVAFAFLRRIEDAQLEKWVLPQASALNFEDAVVICLKTHSEALERLLPLGTMILSVEAQSLVTELERFAWWMRSYSVSGWMPKMRDMAANSVEAVRDKSPRVCLDCDGRKFIAALEDTAVAARKLMEMQVDSVGHTALTSEDPSIVVIKSTEDEADRPEAILRTRDPTDVTPKRDLSFSSHHAFDLCSLLVKYYEANIRKASVYGSGMSPSAISVFLLILPELPCARIAVTSTASPQSDAAIMLRLTRSFALYCGALNDNQREYLSVLVRNLSQMGVNRDAVGYGKPGLRARKREEIDLILRRLENGYLEAFDDLKLFFVEPTRSSEAVEIVSPFLRESAVLNNAPTINVEDPLEVQQAMDNAAIEAEKFVEEQIAAEGGKMALSPTVKRRVLQEIEDYQSFLTKAKAGVLQVPKRQRERFAKALRGISVSSIDPICHVAKDDFPKFPKWMFTSEMKQKSLGNVFELNLSGLYKNLLRSLKSGCWLQSKLEQLAMAEGRLRKMYGVEPIFPRNNFFKGVRGHRRLHRLFSTLSPAILLRAVQSAETRRIPVVVPTKRPKVVEISAVEELLRADILVKTQEFLSRGVTSKAGRAFAIIRLGQIIDYLPEPHTLTILIFRAIGKASVNEEARFPSVMIDMSLLSETAAKRTNEPLLEPEAPVRKVFVKSKTPKGRVRPKPEKVSTRSGEQPDVLTSIVQEFVKNKGELKEISTKRLVERLEDMAETVAIEDISGSLSELAEGEPTLSLACNEIQKLIAAPGFGV